MAGVGRPRARFRLAAADAGFPYPNLVSPGRRGFRVRRERGAGLQMANFKK